MSNRLVKIAKELNVGTSTIVEFLLSKGFEIENKPTAKVSDEMHEELLRQFSNSMAEKEKADKLVIGTRPVSPKREEHQEEHKATPPPPPPPVEKIVPEQKEKEEVEAPKEELIEAKLGDQDKPKLKVVGKIDLSPKEKKSPEPKVEEVKEVAPEVPKQEEKPKEKEAKPKVEEEMIRGKIPQLKGLKILGKIDQDKLKEPKKKEKAKEQPNQQGGANRTNDNQQRRKRKRKKITPANLRGGDQRQKRPAKKDDEVKAVTKKEIEEKIKATMARLSGGGKNKRQKIRRDNRDEKREKQEQKDLETVSDVIHVTEFVSVSELASLLGVGVTDVITACMNMGVIVSINQRLDAEIIELLAEEFEKEIEFISAEEETDEEEVIVEDDPKDLEDRSPIVTVMGHVDHGKTSLLDYIREAKVAEGEAGGITQHIGAYEVQVGENKNKITFLDTPGHEAFTAMRARGAKITDVAVIIVAADDNVMPQTKEAISHAQAAGVPIVFAINKIDKAGADPERIKQELSNMNFLVEEWGGKYQSQDISAKTGLNIDLLLEKILLESEVLELKANPNRPAIGVVLEASLDKGRGYVTKCLVQNGSMEIGDSMLAGEHSGKIKAMFNERGKRVKKALPAQPVLVLGLSGAPQAGEKFRIVESDQEARQLAARRAQISRELTNRASKRISLDEIGRRLALGSFKELNLIIKGDVDGSIEALSDSLIKLSVESIQVNVIHKAVGQIVESDVLLASASDAIIIGFQVRPSVSARNLAEKEGVEIKTYSIIYKAIEEIRAAMEGMLEAKKEEKILGQLEVRETYKISKIGTIAGCFVLEGKITRNSSIRLIRDGIVIYPTKENVVGEISTLKRFKDDVKEVKNGLECGLTIKNFNDIKVEDNIEVYEIIEVKQTLDD
jgi:translation initiation factor IF-2